MTKEEFKKQFETATECMPEGEKIKHMDRLGAIHDVISGLLSELERGADE